MSENITINFSEFMETARKAAALDILRALRLAERDNDIYLPDDVENIILGVLSEPNKPDGE